MIERVAHSVVEPIADANILRRYAIEDAAWIWHPALGREEHAALQFLNVFEVSADATCVLHVSADQRYSLYLDGELISRGPDRSDPAHWSFASYRLKLPAGIHELRADVWWLGDLSPVAQMSVRGGFILKAEELGELLDTGTGNWRVAQRAGLTCGPKLHGNYHVIGPAFEIDGAAWHQELTYDQATVVDRFRESLTGVVHPGWELHPSPLPEQLARPVCPGSIRAVYTGDSDLAEGHLEAELAPWQGLLTGTPMTVPARQRRHLIWDLEDYYCAYAELTLSGGSGAKVSWEWAESLFEVDDQPVPRKKGDRNAIEGKRFFGFGDHIHHAGGEAQAYASPWWRSGRYIRLSVQTADTPLTLKRIALQETGYPIELQSSFQASPGELEKLIPLAVRGIRMCAHETFMDCPYYEQLMYVGDTRLQALTLYTMTRDDRLSKRAIELFDWSRWKTGFVAERYPSDPFQLSLTFSLLWISMVHDHMLWRNDLPWIRERLVGVRCLMEHFHLLAENEGLLRGLPGWSFMDWVNKTGTSSWDAGVPPDGRKGLSSSINLLYLQALRQTAELEDACGEPELASRNRRLAKDLTARLVETFWDDARGLLADNADHTEFSEHSQCLALLNDALSGERKDRCWQGLIADTDLARCTVYFSFYLLETYQRFGRGDLLLEKLSFWQELLAKGLKTPVESPEPSRSDCHAWGSHPLFHFHATLAGIRPAAPGFQKILIQPAMGNLTSLSTTLPHPNGELKISLKVQEEGLHAEISLPKGIPGTLCWHGEDYILKPGRSQTLSLP